MKKSQCKRLYDLINDKIFLKLKKKKIERGREQISQRLGMVGGRQ